MSMSAVDVAATLRGLATDARLAGSREELEALADALTGPDNELDQWMYLDLPSAFIPTDTPPREREGRGWHRYLHIAPQFLVFLPILITWLGLSMASHAYNTLLQSGQDLEQRNFLELWQQGFDGTIPAFLTFEKVALYTVAAIVLLLAVGLWSAVDRRNQEELSDYQDETFRQRLASTLVSAMRVLASHRVEAPMRFEAGLTRTAEQLADMHSEAKKLQTSARSAVTASTKASDQLSASVTDIAASIGSIAARLEDLENAVASLRANEAELTASIVATGASAAAITSSVTSSTDRIGVMLQHESTRSTQQMADAMRSFDSALNSTVASLRDSLDELTTALQAGSSSYEAAMDLAGQVIASAQGVSNTNTTVSQQVARTADSLPDAVSLQRMMQTMDALAKSIDGSAQRLAEISSQLVTTGKLVETVVSDLERQNSGRTTS